VVRRHLPGGVYQLIDVKVGPAMRKRVQTRMFATCSATRRATSRRTSPASSPEGQGGRRACISIMEMPASFDQDQLMLIVSMVLLIAQDGRLAVLLGTWMVVYLIGSGCSLSLRRFVEGVLARSAPARQLIDAISNADTIRSFARWRHERCSSTTLEAERRRSSSYEDF